MSEKSLICINTCNRINLLKFIITDYLEFCRKTDEFDFLLSLDGNNDEIISFCNKYNIPLLFSEEREGVGISKNRVLKEFSDYNYYFFIDDDVKLLNPDVFKIHIEVSKNTGIHHLSSGEIHRFKDIVKYTGYNNVKIMHSNLGSGAFNFFTKHGLDIVGGWHDEFVKYKRFGHTEHSNRFYNNGIAPAPFNVIINCTDNYFLWLNPPAVTKYEKSIVGKYLAIPEEKLIEKKLKYYPVTTFSNYKIINFISGNKSKKPVNNILDNDTKRYILLFRKYNNVINKRIEKKGRVYYIIESSKMILLLLRTFKHRNKDHEFNELYRIIITDIKCKIDFIKNFK
jgi:hypothetical protein